jgi:hypothetical protein
MQGHWCDSCRMPHHCSWKRPLCSSCSGGHSLNSATACTARSSVDSTPKMESLLNAECISASSAPTASSFSRDAWAFTLGLLEQMTSVNAVRIYVRKLGDR